MTTPETGPPALGLQRRRSILPAAVFFLSGCAGLIFEVLAARKLALATGSTVASSAATAAAFLLGLGLGSYLGGRLAPGQKNQIRLFALLELGAGLGCAVALLVVDALPRQMAGLDLAMGSLETKLLASFLVFLPPCILMGASLPVLCQYYVKTQSDRLLKVLAGLYAINTLGAVVGVLSTDFLLVQRIGMQKTGLIAVGLYFLVAALAWKVSASELHPGLFQVDGPSDLAFTPAPRVALLALIGTGFCGLTYQVLWTRMLTFFNGNDVFSFSTTLAVYLGGIVVGSLVISRFGPYLKDPRLVLGLSVAAISVLAYSSLFAVAWVREGRALLVLWGVRDPWLSLSACLLVVSPSALLLGTSFPLASKMLQQSVSEPAAVVGKAYLANSLGSATGAFLAGLYLLPNLGLQASLMWTSVASMALATVLLWSRGVGRVLAVLAPLVLAVIIMATPPDRLLKILYQERFADIVYQGDDHYGSVALARHGQPSEQGYEEVLYVDNFNMAGNSPAAKRYTTCLAALPILVHPNPQRVLVICMGLGNTTRAALEMQETKSVECVELSSKVLEALLRTAGGKKILDNPKLTVTLGDGRNHLLNTDAKYDVISAEPPPPMNAGVVNLYSREYYELCRERLNPKGIAVQWLPVFEMSPFEAKTIIVAFQEVFPYTTLWEGSNLQLVLLGSLQPIEVDLERLKSRVKNNHAFLKQSSLDDPYLVASLYLAGPEDLREYTKGVPPLTDDWPRIQYPDLDWRPDVGFFFFSDRQPEIAAREQDLPLLARARKAIRSARFFTDGQKIDAGVGELAKLELGRAYFEVYPDDGWFAFLTRSTHQSIEQMTRMTETSPQDPRAFEALARSHFFHSDLARARQAAERASALSPTPVFSDLLLPLIVLREGGEGPAQALVMTKELAKLSLGGLEKELKYLQWLLRMEGDTPSTEAVLEAMPTPVVAPAKL